MKKIIVVLFSLIMAFSFHSFAADGEIPYPVISSGGPIPVSASAKAAMSDTSMKVEVRCKSALLMEEKTGMVLMAMNENERLYPASVTKIMSLLLVCEAIEQGVLSLDRKIAASAEACEKGGSQIWLEEGEEMTVDELLKATCVFSANDACTLLGEAVAGSDEAFVEMMNEKAAQLGMTKTHFENCTGLDDTADDHKTTAYDIALMSRALLRHDIVKKYSKIYMDSLRGGETQLVNTNKLVRSYKGITGLKTGTTDKAGCCISATAERDGLSLIAVVLGAERSDDRFAAAKAMLDWGFANYECCTPQIDPDSIPEVHVERGVSAQITPIAADLKPLILARGQKSEIKTEFDVIQSLEAPIEKGQTLGSVRFILAGELLAEFPLKAADQVDRLKFTDYIRYLFTFL